MINFKILIFAPHPDDETLGAGGSIMKWIEEGHDIHIVWFTDGRAGYRIAKEENKLEECEETRISEEELAEIRLAEADAAGDLLGVKKENRYFLKFFDQELKNHVDDAIEKIQNIVKNADRFVIPSANNSHPDHQATHDIGIKVAQELNFIKLEFYVYALYNPLKAQGDNLVKIKIGNFRSKVNKALQIHKSQFYTKDMVRNSLAIRDRHKEQFGFYTIKDKGKFFNF